jgi:hypothetical protein
MENTKTIYELELHEILPTLNWSITRVPGGWIYRPQGNLLAGTFVPFNDEFRHIKPKENE